ncbi:hypothetical protein PPERSA_03385 [Pseudocohnilembus persalinus]|uniref:Lipoprotein n=1 Tax=Pseudocohnilembus persalinus TaxID=266149 RepID=A0A0V0QM27_PSEPJ|nr:hypothetical protein PPERSA_03385 [Pseudocohnilembus persalinus]|eukprot:KRX03270.1 hypothetical protein PPERSA_03385 [Pseudocohnilembus persalinus]
MRKLNFTFLALIFILFTLSTCLRQFDIENVQNWDKSDVTQKENIELKNIINDQFSYYNSEILQITSDKVVTMLVGEKKDTENKYIYELAVYDSKGIKNTSKIFDDVQKYYLSSLSLTNVRGEFVHIVNKFFGIYITMYDENLQVTRNVDDQLLEGFDDFFGFYEPIVSVGKNLMYISMTVQDYLGPYYKRVYVLDLSDRQSLKLIEKYTYFDYPDNYFFANSIQAFNDGSAILHFYNMDKDGESILVQVRYDSEGKEMPNYPKELNSPLSNLQEFFIHWPWHSHLHEDGEIATFLANDLNNNLMIYTYNMDGENICAKLNDITGYHNQWYYYGIIGNQGWIYLADSLNLEGHFGLFDANQCILNTENLVNTGIFNGVAGSLIEGENQQVCIFEFGNSDGEQESYQVMLYRIGSFEGEEEDDFLEEEDDEGEEEGEGILEGEDEVGLIE